MVTWYNVKKNIMMFEINKNLNARVNRVCNSLIIEIENFYENPDEVREYAITSKKYTKNDNNDLLAYAIGRRVCEDDFRLEIQMKEVFYQLCNHPEWNIKFDEEHHNYRWSGMRFMVNVTNNKEILNDGRNIICHVDGPTTKWACVVYLNILEECEGGTGFYSLNDDENLKVEYISKMKYNKAVLYDSNIIHGAILNKTMFKTCDRLVQVMFM